jgi:hypothetical protein
LVDNNELNFIHSDLRIYEVFLLLICLFNIHSTTFHL